MTSEVKTSTYACFDCRKHRSLLVYVPYLADTVSCPECQASMHSIGCKLRVPRKDDVDGWKKLWAQYTSPGYGVTGVLEIDSENAHFEVCKLKKLLLEDESTGCDRCDKVWKRLLEDEKRRWQRMRTHNRNG